MFRTLAEWGFYLWAFISVASVLVMAYWVIRRVAQLTFYGLRWVYHVGTRREVRWWR